MNTDLSIYIFIQSGKEVIGKIITTGGKHI